MVGADEQTIAEGTGPHDERLFSRRTYSLDALGIRGSTLTDKPPARPPKQAKHPGRKPKTISHEQAMQRPNEPLQLAKHNLIPHKEN